MIFFLIYIIIIMIIGSDKMYNLYDKEVECILENNHLITGTLYKHDNSNKILINNIEIDKDNISSIELISNFQLKVKDYLDYVRLERRLSINTYDSYKNDLDKYYLYCRRRNIKDVRLITKDIIRDYLEFLNESGLEIKSIARKLTTIKNFHNFLYFTNYLDKDVSSSLESPKLKKTLPRVLTIEEIDKLLNIECKTVFDYRDKAMLELMYATGLRVSELVSLTLNEIDLEECIVRCMGKGKKERMIPIGEYVLDSIRNYLALRPKLYRLKHSDHLFLNNHGEGITRHSFYNMIKKRLMECNINVELSPHTLRHSFATHMIENGSDLRIVQELLGHSDISTTRIYTHISNHKVRSDYEKFHPRSKK